MLEPQHRQCHISSRWPDLTIFEMEHIYRGSKRSCRTRFCELYLERRTKHSAMRFVEQTVLKTWNCKPSRDPYRVTKRAQTGLLVKCGSILAGRFCLAECDLRGS